MSNAKKSSIKKPSRQKIIHNAVSSLQRLESSLDLDCAMLPDERKRLQGLGTVPAKAIAIAGNIAKQNPERFMDFDVQEMSGAVEFENEMAPLADQARAFADHLEQAIQKRRAPAASSTLALYAIVKGLGRVRANQAFRDHAANLHVLLKRRRKAPQKNKDANANAAAPAGASAQAPGASTSVIAPAPAAAASPATTNGSFAGRAS